jgi:5-keto 4-deoxyuronate isomerase
MKDGLYIYKMKGHSFLLYKMMGAPQGYRRIVMKTKAVEQGHAYKIECAGVPFTK